MSEHELNIEKYRKAFRIAQIRNELHCTYEQAEQIYNEEKVQHKEKSHS